MSETPKSEPLVTVLMPLLNPHPEHFPRAVESILRQTFEDFELLIVEDPSPRSGRELLENLQDPRVRHVENPERTSFDRQLNQGLELARGEWVARMDADDVSRPERLARQVAHLRQEPQLTVLGSNIAIIDDAGQHLGYRSYPLSHDAIAATMPRYNAMAHPSVIFHRETVIAVGGYQKQMYNEDYDLWSRLIQAGKRFENLPEPFLEYRVHPAGMKSSKLREMITATHDIKNEYWAEQMSAGDRGRMWLERLLLWLPPRLVLKLFLRMTLVKELEQTRKS